MLIHDPTAVDRTFVIGEAVRLGARVGPRRDGRPMREWTDAVAALRPGGRSSARLPDAVEDPVGEPLDVYRRTAAQLDGFAAALAGLLAPASATAASATAAAASAAPGARPARRDHDAC